MQGLVSAGHPVNIATGAVFTTLVDFAVPGKIRLSWQRGYNTAHLGSAAGRLGPGWSAPYFATLTRYAGAYELTLPEGGKELFHDPEGTVERGGVVRNLPTFQELTRTADAYLITRWGPLGQAPERLVFPAHGQPAPMPLVRMESAAGAALDITYDNYGRVLRVQQRLEQRALQLEYVAGGHIGAVVFVAADGASQVVASYGYDGQGRLVSATDALGRTDRYEYDPDGRIVREVRKDGAVFSFKYDMQGRCIRSSGLDRYDEKVFRYIDAARWTEVTDSLGNTTRYQWLPTGQVVTVVTPIGGQEKTEFDEIGRIASRVLPAGEETHYRFDSAGNGSEVVDPNGNTWRYEYDAGHRRTTSTDPMGRTWRWRYDEAGRLIAVEQPGGGRFDYRWDVAGNLIEVRTPRGPFKRFRYDARGALVESVDAAGNATRYVRDPFGRLAQVVNARGHRYRVSHDLLGRTTAIEYPDGTSETFEYDAGDNQIAATDRDGNTRRYRWGPCRRLLEATNANGETVRFRWGTELDRLEEVTNEKGESMRLEYNPVGRCTRQIWFDGHERSFVHDLSGQVIKIQNGEGETVGFGWDPCGRLVERRLPDGAGHRLTYDKSGLLVSAETPERTVRFERDAAGLVIREIQGDHVVESVRDATGLRTRIATDLGHAVDFDIDAALQVQRLTLPSGDAFAFEFDELGSEATRLLPGGLRLAFEYDGSGRVTLHQLTTGSAAPAGAGAGRTLIRRSYDYAPGGPLLRRRDGRRGLSDYRYDPEQRITGVSRDGRPAEGFRYDAAGNITEVTWAEAREELHYAPGSRIETAGDVRYEFDGQGRLVRRVERDAGGRPAEWRFTWDALDQLRSVSRPDGKVWRYSYDFFGRRFAKEGPGSRTTYVWDGDVIIHELPNGKPATSWVYADNARAPLAKVVGREVFSVIGDQIETPQELVTRKGDIAWSARSSVWGLDLGHDARVTDCPIRFRGQWADPESGLHYNRFRYYEPRTARYISRDPIGARHSLNLYRYAPNPLNWIDPLGLDVCANRQKGEDFKDGVRDQYEDAGWTVHEEVTVQVTTNPGPPPETVRTRIDLVATDPTGTTTHYIETKASDTAPYTPNQTAAGVGTPPGTLVGPAQVRSSNPDLPVTQGQNLPSGTQVSTVRPGDQLPGLPPGTTAQPP